MDCGPCSWAVESTLPMADVDSRTAVVAAAQDLRTRGLTSGTSATVSASAGNRYFITPSVAASFVRGLGPRLGKFRRSRSATFVAAGVLYALVVSFVFSSVMLGDKTLQAPAYVPYGPERFVEEPPARAPVNTFNIDLATPAFYEWPIDVVVGEQLRDGQAPLWNPHQGAGTPLLEQFSSRALFPYQMLQNVSPSELWDVFTLGRLWIAGFLTFVFLMLLRVRPIASFVGGLAFMLSGSFVWFINLEQLTNVAMLVPLLMISAEVLVRPQARFSIPLMAVSVALVIYAGQPEVAGYALLLMVGYLLIRTVTGPGQWLSTGGRAVAGLGLALPLSAPLLLPFLDFADRSVNFHPPGGALGMQDPAKIEYVAGILAPGTTEASVFVREFPDNGIWDWLGGYTGVTVAVLVGLGLLWFALYPKRRARDDVFLFFAGFGVLILLKNFGFPLVDWIGQLPLLDQIWTPRWAGPTWTFSLAVAAAIWLDRMHGRGTDQPRSWVTATIGWVRQRAPRVPTGSMLTGSLIVAALLALVAGTLLAEDLYSDLITTNPRAAEVLTGDYLIPSVVAAISVAAVVLLVALTLARREPSRTNLAAWGLLLLVELWYAVPRGYDADTQLLKLLPLAMGLIVVALASRSALRDPFTQGTAAVGLVFFVGGAVALDWQAGTGAPDQEEFDRAPPHVEFLQEHAGFDRVFGLGDTLLPNYASAYGLYDISIIDALAEDSFYEYRTTLLQPTAPSPLSSSMLWFNGLSQQTERLGGGRSYVVYADSLRAQQPFYDFLGVRYIVTPLDVDLNAPPLPRSLLTNGQLDVWSSGPGPFTEDNSTWADAWDVDLVGDGAIRISREGSEGQSSARAVYATKGGNESFLRQAIHPIPFEDATVTFEVTIYTTVPEAVRIGLSGSGLRTTWSEPHGGGGWQTLELTGNITETEGKTLLVLIAIGKSSEVRIRDARLSTADFHPRPEFPYYTALVRDGDGTVTVDPSAINQISNGGLDDWSRGAGPFAVPEPDLLLSWKGSADAAVLTNAQFVLWPGGDGPFTGDGIEWAAGWDADLTGGSRVALARSPADSPDAVRVEFRGNEESWLRQLFNQGDDRLEYLRGKTITFSADIAASSADAVRVGLSGSGVATRWSESVPGDERRHTVSATTSVPAGNTEPVVFLISMLQDVEFQIFNVDLVVDGVAADVGLLAGAVHVSAAGPDATKSLFQFVPPGQALNAAGPLVLRAHFGPGTVPGRAGYIISGGRIHVSDWIQSDAGGEVQVLIPDGGSISGVMLEFGPGPGHRVIQSVELRGSDGVAVPLANAEFEQVQEGQSSAELADGWILTGRQGASASAVQEVDRLGTDTVAALRVESTVPAGGWVDVRQLVDLVGASAATARIWANSAGVEFGVWTREGDFEAFAEHPGDGAWRTLELQTDQPIAAVGLRIQRSAIVRLTNIHASEGSEPLPYVPQTRFREVYADAVRIFENPRSFPRTFLVWNADPVTSQDEALQRISEPGFDLRGTVVVEALAAPIRDLGHSVDRAGAEIVRYDPADVTVSVRDNPQTGLLVLTDTWAPGWEAWVDGSPAPVYRVNGVVRGVMVGLGDHTVRFRYSPSGFAAGVAMALAGLGAVVALLLWPAIRARR
jgi:hypothetical protein